MRAASGLGGHCCYYFSGWTGERHGCEKGAGQEEEEEEGEVEGEEGLQSCLFIERMMCQDVKMAVDKPLDRSIHVAPSSCHQNSNPLRAGAAVAFSSFSTGVFHWRFPLAVQHSILNVICGFFSWNSYVSFLSFFLSFKLFE